jgi:hypothetical protein
MEFEELSASRELDQAQSQRSFFSAMHRIARASPIALRWDLRPQEARGRKAGRRACLCPMKIEQMGL